MVEEKLKTRLNYLVYKCRKEKIDISDIDIKYYRCRNAVLSEQEFIERIQKIEKKILLNKLSKYKEVL